MGEWRSLLRPQYPDVACFVDETWPETMRLATLRYLQQERKLHYWMGMETCLFGCGQNLHITGCTDGTYYWPESLVHYLAQHAVRLPDEFVEHIQQQPLFPTGTAAAADKNTEADFTWWKTQRGWHPAASSLQYLSKPAIRDFLRRYDQGHIDYSGLSSAADKAALLRMTVELRELLP
ncbi:hypothetical protein Hsw_0887 [Hymenobacter swuensis DY53]|uniref:Uncharacterized protein n=2 Tax=Hymenobacter TaxID=89966 RepID=W8EXL2_9BACT|nr:hypothetical protein Hsw_0887 [Hymenobacter swuensis DY53]